MSNCGLSKYELNMMTGQRNLKEEIPDIFREYYDFVFETFKESRSVWFFLAISGATFFGILKSLLCIKTYIEYKFKNKHRKG